MQEIKRDTIAPPPHKSYPHPTEYKATDPYEVVLKDLPTEWTREVQVRDGKVTPGKGPDFPGELGAEDLSGIILATQPKPAPAADAAVTTDAAHVSEPEDYETDREGPADDEDDEDQLAGADDEAGAA